MLEDLLFTSFCVAGGALLLNLFVRRRLTNPLWRLAGYGFLAHCAAVFAQVWITREVFGGGDIFEYWRSGVVVADALRSRFFDYTPELALAFFHQDYLLPFEVFGAGSTLSQTVVVSYLLFYLGDSLYAASMAVALFSFFGKLSVFFAFRPVVAKELQPRLMVAVVLVPSVVFWSGTIAKEAIVVGCVGFAVLALQRLMRLQSVAASVAVLALALPVIAMIKPYTLLPLSLAAGVWFYVDRSERRGIPVVVKPIYLALGAAVALAGTAALGRFVPEYSVENLGNRTASAQAAGAQAGGGSYYQFSEAPESVNVQRSLASQLVYAPLALLTALFRPLPFDVRNTVMAISAVEATFLLVLFLRALRRVGPRRMLTATLNSPVLAMCMTFSITFGTAVGLASTNMGTLSRYRMPFLPFFVFALFTFEALRSRARVAAADTTDSLAAATPR